MQSKKNTLVITHSSTYHSDELFACALLSVFYNKKVMIVRTLEPEVELKKFLENCDNNSEVFILDIGKRNGTEYIKNKNNEEIRVIWLDHHQDVNSPCAAVLVMQWLVITAISNASYSLANLIEVSCKDWLPGVDAHDRGLDETPAGTMTISRLIASSLPNNPKLMDACFENQLNWCKVFVSTQLEITKENIKNSSIRAAAISKCQTEKSGFVETDIYMREFTKELDNRVGDDILYYVYPHGRGGYALQTVAQIGKMEPRYKLLDENCKGATFIHAAKFLAIFPTRELAIEAAQKQYKDYIKSPTY